MNKLGIVLAAALLALAAGCGGGDDDTAPADTAATAAQGGGGGSTLRGSVGPGFSISVDGADGITAGDYTLVVDDKASSHNFHLTGPGGVNVATDVAATGEESFDVTLEPGEYMFVCDAHPESMQGTFTVG